MNSVSINTAYQHASTWTREQLLGSQDWILQLDASHNNELREALEYARARGARIPALSAKDFPLPTLGPRLIGLCHELMHGRGISLIRGFDIDSLSLEDAALVYWGIGMHLGSARAQNAQGDLLGHVTDLGVDYRTDHGARGYQTSLRLPFHNDALDVVGLLCLRTSRAGGQSRFVSSTALYNAVLERRPDLMATFCAPFYMDRRGEEPEGKLPYYQGAIFEWVGKRLFVRYNRTFIESAQRFSDVPRLDSKQREALDLMDALCNDPIYCVEMPFKRGDMQFLCNYTVLHSRGAYEDWPERERRRYLLRLWLDSGRLEQLPASYAERFEDTARWQANPKPPVFDLSARHNELAH